MQTRHFVAGALVVAAALASRDPAAPAVRPARVAVEVPRPVPRAFPAPTPYEEPTAARPARVAAEVSVPRAIPALTPYEEPTAARPARVAVEVSVPRASPAPTPYEEPDPSIPGGGRILIPIWGSRVVQADGTLEYLWTEGEFDAVWDPGRPGTPLVLVEKPQGAVLRAYRRTGPEWGTARRWGVGAIYWDFAEFSPDGRLIAHSVFTKWGEGGRLTGTIQVVSRNGDRLWELRTDDLYPVSWTPEGTVLLSHWFKGGLFAWDMKAGTITTLILDDSQLTEALPAGARSPWLDARFLSWSADGRYFAARVSWRLSGKRHRYGIAIGSPSGEILNIVKTGRKHPNIPTWSPARPEVAFIDSSSLDSKATLFVYDVVSGRRTVLMSNSPHPWWVAWAPRGDWMLLDGDYWLFVSRDGKRTIKHDRLGAFPRWASPGHDIPVPKC
jgi:hypothetical protein